MPINRLNIYDIIVDVFPAIVAVILAVILFVPIEAFYGLDIGYSLIGITIVLVSLLYITGRFIHGIASGIDTAVRWTVPKIHTKLRYFEIYNKISEMAFPVTGPHMTFERHMEYGLAPFTPFTLKTAMAYELMSEIDDQYDVKTNQLDRHKMSEIKHFCHSLLYDKHVLYRKYEILTTFFRSLYVVFLFSFLASAIETYWAIKGVLPILSEQPIWFVFANRHQSLAISITLLMFLFFLIFLHQRRKFSHRRGRALIYDSVDELKK